MKIEFSPGLCIPGYGGTAEVLIDGDVATVTVKEADGKIVGQGLYRLDPDSGAFKLESGNAWRPPVNKTRAWSWRPWRH